MTQAIKALLIGGTGTGTTLFEITYALFRFYCGISIAIGAGWSKVFHKINEEGSDDWSNKAFGVPDWFVEQVGDIGFTFISPKFWAHLAVYGEFIGGLLIALGLLTRISAIQLAFQFFVVAFIWYEAPELFGMYYQQLIFWSFVLIAVHSGGRFSFDQWIKKGSWAWPTAKKAATIVSLLLLPTCFFAQNSDTPTERISFTLNNPSLKTQHIDIRYFNQQTQTSSGYGYDLGAFQSHAVNMPIGTRVYKKEGQSWALHFVLTAKDQGRGFDVTAAYAITEAQRTAAEQDEAAAALAKQEEENEEASILEKARENDLPVVSFYLSGKTWWSRQIYVRIAYPFEEPSPNSGFSRKLNRFSRFPVSYPAGTKLYLCDGIYWNGQPVEEKLLLTVTAEMTNDTIRI